MGNLGGPVPQPPYDDTEDLRTLAIRVNGFVYAGDRLNAVIETVKALRADPELARRLLEEVDR